MANIFTYTFFIIGLFLIIKGGDIFVDSATQAAKILKIPNIIIGATIVSIATTLPEIIVSVQATVTKNVDMAVGNAIGSVTANTALILGLFITFMPFEIKRRDIFFKGISMILAIISLIIGCVITKKQTLQFKGESKEYYFLSALGVTLLISVFAVFIFENIKSIKNEVKNVYSKRKSALYCFICFRRNRNSYRRKTSCIARNSNSKKLTHFAKGDKRNCSCNRHFPAGTCNGAVGAQKEIRNTFGRQHTRCKHY